MMPFEKIVDDAWTDRLTDARQTSIKLFTLNTFCSGEHRLHVLCLLTCNVGNELATCVADKNREKISAFH